MAKHTVRMTEPEHDIVNSDIDFWVWADETQLGHLHISKGGIDWYAGKSSVNKRFLNWETFKQLIEANVELIAAPKPKRKR